MYTFTNFVQYLPFFVQMCIILTTFVYLQYKLALQVQSKHITIFKTKTKNKKQKTKTKTKLKPTGILEGGKKTHKQIIGKKKKNFRHYRNNVKMLWT